MDIAISDYQPSDSIPELTELIHGAYKQLGDMGLRFVGTWQTEDMTLDRIQDAHTTLVGRADNKIVATVSLYRSKVDHKCEHYRSAWYFGQFAVDPSLQKSGIGSRLIEHVEDIAKAAGAPFIALDTAESAGHLIAFYEKRGYSFVQYQQWDEPNYRSVIMSKPLGG